MDNSQVHLGRVVIAQAGRARHVDVYRYRQLLRVCPSGEGAQMIGLSDAWALAMHAASGATDLLTQVCAALLRQGLLGGQDEQRAPRVLN